MKSVIISLIFSFVAWGPISEAREYEQALQNRCARILLGTSITQTQRSFLPKNFNQSVARIYADTTLNRRQQAQKVYNLFLKYFTAHLSNEQLGDLLHFLNTKVSYQNSDGINAQIATDAIRGYLKLHLPSSFLQSELGIIILVHEIEHWMQQLHLHHAIDRDSSLEPENTKLADYRLPDKNEGVFAAEIGAMAVEYRLLTALPPHIRHDLLQRVQYERSRVSNPDWFFRVLEMILQKDFQHDFLTAEAYIRFNWSAGRYSPERYLKQAR